MAFLRVRSFQGRIFAAILLVVLVPTALAVAGGVATLRDLGTRSGTLGAWDAVAGSGQRLLDQVDRLGPSDDALRRAAAEHRQALTESVRMSRMYVYFAERVLDVLPLAALVAGLILAAVAFFTARRLSRGFGAPVAELAGWTERIARGEPLPPEGQGVTSVEELTTLRVALRRMADQLEAARRREIENVRMRSWTNLARKVAHEIKNPLTPMRMAASTLTRGRDGAEGEAGRILLEEIQRLDEMARTFSQYGRLPEGPRSQVELVELLTGLASQHGSEAVPVSVSGDPVLV
ncbi:MAG TPA: histidine kinase dimerization/phospho-acceptor domain-containing protein, partial [Longimicrobiales bacterium]|nr:histidine kinase dimerization/phospho-acceptor domain-containing protein [Longimicrobiales bacterium]